MSTNLYLRKLTSFDDFPGWEERGNAGAKEMIRSDLPREYARNADGDRLCRPTDFSAWRKFIVDQEFNAENWLAMLDVLEANSDVWIAVSQ